VSAAQLFEISSGECLATLVSIFISFIRKVQNKQSLIGQPLYFNADVMRVIYYNSPCFEEDGEGMYNVATDSLYVYLRQNYALKIYH
jgi:hypothetical protein